MTTAFRGVYTRLQDSSILFSFIGAPEQWEDVLHGVIVHMHCNRFPNGIGLRAVRTERFGTGVLVMLAPADAMARRMIDRHLVGMPDAEVRSFLFHLETNDLWMEGGDLGFFHEAA